MAAAFGKPRWLVLAKVLRNQGKQGESANAELVCGASSRSGPKGHIIGCAKPAARF
jgi:hypothetical protein